VALVKIFASLAAEQPSDTKTLCLAHVRDVLADNATEVGEHVRSADLCAWLAAIEDGPWANWGKSGKPINQNQLARQLKGFAFPTPFRIGDKTPRGYHVASLERAFDRYLPSTPDLNRNTVTNDDVKGLNADSKPQQTTQCCTLKNDVSPFTSTNVSVLHPEKGGKAGGGLPSCPQCGSFAMYPTTSGYECETCAMGVKQ